jgi:hypothetical protein
VVRVHGIDYLRLRRVELDCASIRASNLVLEVLHERPRVDRLFVGPANLQAKFERVPFGRKSCNEILAVFIPVDTLHGDALILKVNHEQYVVDQFHHGCLLVSERMRDLSRCVLPAPMPCTIERAYKAHARLIEPVINREGSSNGQKTKADSAHKRPDILCRPFRQETTISGNVAIQKAAGHEAVTEA